MALSDLINDYCQNGLFDLNAEMEHYKGLPTVEEAIDNACLGIYKVGNKTFFSNHYKYAYSVSEKSKRWNILDLYNARKILLNCISDIEDFQSFESIYTFLEEKIRPLSGIGNMLQYDISLRIGANMNVWPDKVYAQLGALYGVNGLLHANYPKDSRQIFNFKNTFIRNFPEFNRLKAYEAENFLCVFDNELQNLD
ncbi:MAG: hypothetical protein K8R53_00770 [Bacteroidales bacterium]|nr:hypothetical protein [Bacteroidales bacterium]